jgi:N-acetylmuramoyl-L-alanine amidase
VADERTVVHYYRVPAFESVEGRSLAERIGQSMRADDAPFGTEPLVSGVRLPVLRETRMPAVLVILGPARPVCDRAAAETATVIGAVAAWLAREG